MNMWGRTFDLLDLLLEYVCELCFRNAVTAAKQLGQHQKHDQETASYR